MASLLCSQKYWRNCHKFEARAPRRRWAPWGPVYRDEAAWYRSARRKATGWNLDRLLFASQTHCVPGKGVGTPVRMVARFGRIDDGNDFKGNFNLSSNTLFCERVWQMSRKPLIWRSMDRIAPLGIFTRDNVTAVLSCSRTFPCSIMGRWVSGRRNNSEPWEQDICSSLPTS